MTAAHMRRHAFRFISSKQICYILFIECISSPIKLQPVSSNVPWRFHRRLRLLILDSSLWSTLLFEMNRSVAEDRSRCVCFFVDFFFFVT